MIRRNVRLRREYLYRKQQNKGEQERQARIDKLRAPSAELSAARVGGPAAVEAAQEEAAAAAAAARAIDDEYALASAAPPRVCVTTSRAPSSRLKQFAKEMRILFPDAQRLNRGNTTINELMDACRRGDFSDVVVRETRAGRSRMRMCPHPPSPPSGHAPRPGLARRS